MLDSIVSRYKSGDTLYIVGEITNSGSSDLTFVKIFATLYDSTNSISGTTFTYTDHQIFLHHRQHHLEL